MRQPVLVALTVSALAFCIAGTTELRSKRDLSEKVRCLIPVALGIAAFGLILLTWFFLMTPSSSDILSWVMTIFYLAIATSAAFVRYSRKSTSILMALGGILMAVFWLINRVRA
jgi:FtsH-binding integral membrane protein